MGLFRSKDKSRPDSLTAPTPAPATNEALAPPSFPNYDHNNSYGDSTASSSNISSADTRVNQHQLTPGTTVTTTTTTTTSM